MSGDRKGRAYYHRQNRGVLRLYIFNIHDFDLLLGYPLEKLLTSYQGSLDELLRETASATTTSCSKNLLASHFPKQDPFEEMMHISLFISSELIFFDIAKPITSKGYDLEDTLHFCEDKRSSSPSIEFEPHPAGPECVVLDHDRESTLIFHDESLEMENSWDMELYEESTLDSKEKDSTN